MSEFEKAELLKERANVSFEEARDALRACNGKIADALDMIERRKRAAEDLRRSYGNDTGMTGSFDGSGSGYASGRNYGTGSGYGSGRSYGSGRNYGPCTSCRYSDESYGSRNESFGTSLWRLIKTAFRKSVENDLVVSDKGVEKFRVPVLVFLIVLSIFSMGVLIAMGVSLFFGISYSFRGRDDLSRVNRVINDVGTRANRWWENNSHISYETQQLCHKYDDMDEKNR